MNRIRTVATGGIVAGSVALAAAILSSGGVGASFVDAAEASASISVADHLDGLEPDGCIFTLYLDGKEVDLGNGQLPFDLSQVAQDGGDGGFTATLDFDVSSPDPQASDTQWTVTPSGDLTSTMTSNSHGVTVTFWWPKPSKDHHVKGSAFITLTCTPRPDHAADNGDDHDSSGRQQQSDDSAGIIGAHALSPLPRHGNDGTPDLPPETFTMEATIDAPAADRSGPTCDSHPATPDDCTAGDQTPSDDTTRPDGATQNGDISKSGGSGAMHAVGLRNPSTADPDS